MAPRFGHPPRLPRAGAEAQRDPPGFGADPERSSAPWQRSDPDPGQPVRPAGCPIDGAGRLPQQLVPTSKTGNRRWLAA
ncbi:hypothetical protein [Sphingopyxis sp.]|uniref:hypothetical protein n=1 Tax=Sphingopyxis sp. TaxID=1908224 RepID=UPI0025EF218C|nr:hypothetical protein [Sphingopyxis sp.]